MPALSFATCAFLLAACIIGRPPKLTFDLVLLALSIAFGDRKSVV